MSNNQKHCLLPLLSAQGSLFIGHLISTEGRIRQGLKLSFPNAKKMKEKDKQTLSVDIWVRWCEHAPAVGPHFNCCHRAPLFLYALLHPFRCQICRGTLLTRNIVLCFCQSITITWHPGCKPWIFGPVTYISREPQDADTSEYNGWARSCTGFLSPRFIGCRLKETKQHCSSWEWS